MSARTGAGLAVVELERYLDIERPTPSPEALVDAFAKLVGLAEAS